MWDDKKKTWVVDETVRKQLTECLVKQFPSAKIDEGIKYAVWLTLPWIETDEKIQEVITSIGDLLAVNGITFDKAKVENIFSGKSMSQYITIVMFMPFFN